MKKILSMLCVLVLCCSCVAAYAAADSLGPKKIKGGQCDFMWPVPNEYRLSSCFYDGRDHYALDIFTGSSKNVVASYNGKVVEVIKNGSGDAGYGNAIMIKHDYKTASGEYITLYSRYAHLASYSVKKGDIVVKGQTIGKTGGTGSGGRPYDIHLDFQILTSTNWRNRKTCSIDPYANFLLELPSGIKKGGTTSCCESYIKKVKKLYSSPAAYLERCVFYSSNGTITIRKSSNLKTCPCSVSTYSSSQTLQATTKGKQYTVTGLYRNTAGNYWYRIDFGGADAYVYAGDVTFLPGVAWGNHQYFSPDGKTLVDANKNYCD